MRERFWALGEELGPGPFAVGRPGRDLVVAWPEVLPAEELPPEAVQVEVQAVAEAVEALFLPVEERGAFAAWLLPRKDRGSYTTR